MDAVEYLKGKNRMCDNCAEDYGEECMLHTKAQEVGELCSTYAQRYPAEAVEIVERWAKEHPAKTRQSEVLKMFPSAGNTPTAISAANFSTSAATEKDLAGSVNGHRMNGILKCGKRRTKNDNTDL